MPTLVYPEGENQPLGTFDPERIQAVQDFYLENGIVQTAVPVEDLYTNEFVQMSDAAQPCPGPPTPRPRRPQPSEGAADGFRAARIGASLALLVVVLLAWEYLPTGARRAEVHHPEPQRLPGRVPADVGQRDRLLNHIALDGALHRFWAS